MKTEDDIILKCEVCGQNLRVPSNKGPLIVTCPNCRNQFKYISNIIEEQLTSGSELIDEFKEALQEEINEIKKRGVHDIVVRNGIFQGESGGRFKYHFRVSNLVTIPDDSPIEIVTKMNRVKGYILSVEGLDLFIALDEFIGEEIVEAKLQSAPYYLLELLKNKLEEVKSNKVNFFFDTSMKLFNKIKNKTGRLYDFVFYDVGDSPNDKQREAIAASLGNEVTFIWGPPGTGKTKTLARIVEVLVKKNKRILILSHTNVAVDKALQFVSQVVSNMEEFQEGKFIRFGASQLPELDEIAQVNINEIRKRKAEPYLNELGKLSSKKSDLEFELNECESILQNYYTRNNLINELASIDNVLEELASRKNSYLKRMEDNKNKSIAIEKDIERYNYYGKIRRFFSGLNLETLIKNKISLQTETENLKKAYNENELKLVDIFNNKEKKDSELEVIESKIKKDKIKFNSVLTRKNKVEKAIKDIDEKIQFVNKLISEVDRKIIDEALVIATTLTKIYINNELKNQRFDAVVVDEGSMAPMPMLFYCAGMSKEKIIIIGDFKQLPPIAMSKSESVKKWLKRDIFEEAGIKEAVNNKVIDDRLVQLQVQYRMHPEIIEISNVFIYNNLLINGDETALIGKDYLNTDPGKGKHIAIYDISSVKPWCSRLPTWSRFNMYSAMLLVKLTKEALKSGIKPKEIGIVAPYRAQINLIQKLIEEDREISKQNLYVNTVHKFQGNEKEIIIFDVVDCHPYNPGKLIDDKMAEGEDERLINVAFTRARGKLIIIADINYIKERHSRTSLLRRMMLYIESKSKEILVNAANELDFYNCNDLKYALNIVHAQDFKIDPEDISVYTQRNFYTAFFADILNAKKKIIIFSPFISERQIDNFIHIFKLLKRRGVEMIIFTRPAVNQSEISQEGIENLIKNIQDEGILVNTKRYNMHEKVSIIDDTIVWMGSLNILSHRYTSEIMYRLVGRHIADELLKNFYVDRAVSYSIKEKELDIHCTKCGSKMVIKHSRFGPFLSCSRFPKCRGIMKITQKNIDLFIDKEEICDKCDSKMIVRRGKRGLFWGCSNYPDCKNTKEIFG